MSILKSKSYKAPVAKIRSFFFSVTFMMCIFATFPITVFAKEESVVVFSQDIYHTHTGGSGGGGCYTVKRTGTRTEEIPCDGTMRYWPDLGTTTCSRCGASYFGDQSHRDCWHKETKTHSYTYYDLGCNMETSAPVGSFRVEMNTKDWTKEVRLTASYQVVSGVNIADKPYIWNGQEATAQNVLTVTQNGNYRLEFNSDTNMVTEAIEIPVSNIDVTAPVMQAYTQEPKSGWTAEGVKVTMGAASDKQPDGSEGSGLHETPYSYDAGTTWSAKTQNLYTENGSYTMMVRDKLGNSSSYKVTIQNIDRSAPVIDALEYDTTPNRKAVTVKITASDKQPDGSEGSGLHDMPYSFDGQKTWVRESEWMVDKNQTIDISVRDNTGNVVSKKITITNIDSYAPVISYEMSETSWTNANVELHLHAVDKNKDGSNGIGLADKWYSLDNGKTWKSEEVLLVDKNGTLQVIARDKNDNRSTKDIVINRIDKEEPEVTLETEVLEAQNGKTVRITAVAEDAGSGLHEEAFSWDEGELFVEKNEIVVEENGTYSVIVRDKAGNKSRAEIVVDMIPEKKADNADKKQDAEKKPDTEKTDKQTEEKPVETEQANPEITVKEKEPAKKKTQKEPTQKDIISKEPVIRKEEDKAVEKKEETVFQPTRIEEPRKQPVKELDRNIDVWKKIAMLAGALVLGAGVLFLLLIFLLRTVAVYVEDEHEKMRFVGRLWIHNKEGRYELHFSEAFLERCATTHFNLRPTLFFVGLHKGAGMCCLFPEDICITLTLKKNMDFSLM